ncbi:hypothetical protein GCM10010124_22430 [Pilimelia terevasa]|uniref:Ricin B lectin domain-containing protein n=1 Tax=Pilimelia terevasa TaxID=53372 RepID=A0A8J3BPF1_9ACTN|nr:RICIN domain-containing protein [Pilimelia terevasa]GGK29192.1 hypothetical protein GCM10010124_22430 [Pilimelia terevasa]
MKRMFLAGAATAMAATLLTAAPAQAVGDTGSVRSVATDRCLDSNNDGVAYTHDCNGGGFQQWRRGSGPQGATFVNIATNRCLDSDHQGNLYTLGCSGNRYQQWHVIRTGVGLKVQNVATGRCLDSNYENSAYTLDCNGGNHQNWIF